MPGSVDHCWTTPSVCTNGDFDTLVKAFIFTNKWLVAQGLYWNMGPATCHACPAVSITFKDFTRFQIVSRNPYEKLAMQCAFIHSPINFKCNIDFLWSIFPVTIFYILSLMLFKEWECLAINLICNAYFIQNSISLHQPLHMFWAIVLLTITLLLFRVYVLKFSIYIVIGI